ncbi:MAG: peptidoglycan-binding domain-containing protein [Candidatus Acidiferrales bacterium]
MKNVSIAASLAFAFLSCAGAASARAANRDASAAASSGNDARHPQQAQQAQPASAEAGHSSSSTTTSKKKKSGHRRHSARRDPTQKAPTPERISEIQSALARGGYYQGEPNGKWDSNTVAALQKFQNDNGLSSSGKIDAPSLQKLGLGSSTAGVDAPKPLPPSGSAAGSTTGPAPTANTTTASSVASATNSAPASDKPQR